MTEKKTRLKSFIGLCREFIAGLNDRRLMMYAAAGTYNIFMSTVPIIMLVVSLVQFLPVTEEQVFSALAEALPEQVITVVERIVAGIYSGGKVALTVSIVLTVWSASCAARQIMKGLDAAYDCTDVKQNIVVFYARGIVYMLIFIAILLVSFLIMAYGGGIIDLLLKYLPHLANFESLFDTLKFLRYIAVALLLFGVFLVIYRFIPKRRGRIADQVPGAAFTALSWTVFSLVFSFYVGFSDSFGAYGIIGTVMVAMMWLYYSIFFLLIGGWLNSFLTERKARKEKEGSL